MLDNVKVYCHNSIKILDENIYFDPFKIEEESKDANIIFITHSHYDHFSEEDILKIKNENTKIVVTTDLEERCLNLGFEDKNIIVVNPEEKHQIEDVRFDTIKAYNINKKFHPKENNWVGYVVEVKGKKYYVAGDTDWIPEMSSVICDVAFLPIGATYTMDVYEAEEATSWISSKIFVPTHYGDIVGEKDLGKKFCSRVKNSIELIKFN